MKRLFDIVAAGAALLILAPVIVVVALAVRATMGRPVLFRQRRAARGGGDFELFKFRSMRDASGPDGQSLPDAERVTPLGRFLRRSRLDELPELLLVLDGRMSFVGPRPLPRALLEREGVLHDRCRTRPGLTGLAQVSGNTLLSDREKFAIDLYYNARRSMAGDMGILLSTLRTVLAGEKRDEILIRKALAHEDGSDRRGR